MNKPMGYDDVEAREGVVSKSLPAGNYECVIVGAKVKKSQSGKEMLVLALDIDAGEYKGYWRDKFDQKRKYNSKAKFPCVYRQLTEGNHTAFFKGLIKAIEESNKGFKFDFDESKLQNKKLGVMFGEEEFRGRDGDILTSCKPMYVCSLKSLNDKPVLAPKKLKQDTGASATGFIDMSGEEISEETLPF